MQEAQLWGRLTEHLSSGNLTVTISEEAISLDPRAQPSNTSQPDESANPRSSINTVSALQELGAREGTRVVLLSSRTREELAASIREATDDSATPFVGSGLMYRHQGNHGQLYTIGENGAKVDPHLGTDYARKAMATEPSRQQRVFDLIEDFHVPLLFVGSLAEDIPAFEALRPGDIGLVVGDAIVPELKKRGLFEPRNLMFVKTPAEAVQRLTALGLPRPTANSGITIVVNRLAISLNDQGEMVGSSGGVATALDSLDPRPKRQIGTLQDGRAWSGSINGMELEALPLTEKEIAEFYEGSCNSETWPAWHEMDDFMPPRTDTEWWKRAHGPWFHTYREVNQRFADRLMDEPYGGQVWVQDYQFQLTPGQLQQARPDLTIGWFNHIPFPAYERFSRDPNHEERLRGLLGADVLGFQTASPYQNFITAVQQTINRAPSNAPFEVNGEPVELRDDGIRVGNRLVTVGRHPISIDFDRFDNDGRLPATLAAAEEVKALVGHRWIAGGVERLEYSKGLIHRVRGAKMLFDEGSLNPREDVFFQSLDPGSRIKILEYLRYMEQFKREVDEVNDAHSFPMINPRTRKPYVRPARRNLAYHDTYSKVPLEKMAGLYRAFNTLLVTPRKDGMNLMAKEFIASRSDLGGVLILAEGAGVAEELRHKGAVMIDDPRDERALADAVLKAKHMPSGEIAERMESLRTQVQAYQVDGWALGFTQAMDIAANRKATSAPRRSGGGRSMHRLIDRGGEPLMNRWTGSNVSRSSGRRGR